MKGRWGCEMRWEDDGEGEDIRESQRMRLESEAGDKILVRRLTNRPSRHPGKDRGPECRMSGSVTLWRAVIPLLRPNGVKAVGTGVAGRIVDAGVSLLVADGPIARQRSRRPFRK